MHHKYLAMGLMLRGKIQFADVNHNIKKLREKVNMIYWNTEGFKYGICDTPTLNLPYSLLTLSNNTGINEIFNKMVGRFNKFYKKKVYVHHYTKFMD